MECDWCVWTEICDECDGEGVLGMYGTCYACGGSGTIEVEGRPQ